MLENTTIVVGTDLTETSQPAVEAAVAIAKRFGARRLVLAHGVKTAGALIALGDAQARSVERARVALDAIELGIDAEVLRVVRSGPPARVVVEVAEEQEAALVVVASHGFGAVRRALVGSTTLETVRAAHCPVLVVGEGREGRGPVTAVTAAVDLSAVSKAVLASAAAFAIAYRAPVRLVSVFEHPGLAVGEDGEVDEVYSEEDIEGARTRYREELDAMASPLRAHDVPVTVQLLERAIPSDAVLADLGEHPASLLVLGTSGHDAWHRLVLGTTADRLICEGPCPVLVIPAGAQAIEDRAAETGPQAKKS